MNHWEQPRGILFQREEKNFKQNSSLKTPFIYYSIRAQPGIDKVAEKPKTLLSCIHFSIQLDYDQNLKVPQRYICMNISQCQFTPASAL